MSDNHKEMSLSLGTLRQVMWVGEVLFVSHFCDLYNFLTEVEKTLKDTTCHFQLKAYYNILY